MDLTHFILPQGVRGGLKEAHMFLPHPLFPIKLSFVGNLRDKEGAFSARIRQGSNFESCVLREVSSHSSHHPQRLSWPS